MYSQNLQNIQKSKLVSANVFEKFCQNYDTVIPFFADNSPFSKSIGFWSTYKCIFDEKIVGKSGIKWPVNNRFF